MSSLPAHSRSCCCAGSRSNRDDRAQEAAHARNGNESSDNVDSDIDDNHNARAADGPEARRDSTEAEDDQELRFDRSRCPKFCPAFAILTAEKLLLFLASLNFVIALCKPDSQSCCTIVSRSIRAPSKKPSIFSRSSNARTLSPLQLLLLPQSSVMAWWEISGSVSSESPSRCSRFSTITSSEQREEYKQAFNSEYPEYQRLHRQVHTDTQVFQQLRHRLYNELEGSQRYEVRQGNYNIKFIMNFYFLY